MKSVTIKGQNRETVGKKEAKKLRSQKIIPAVLYDGDEAIHLAIPFSEIRKLVYTPDVFIVNIDVDGEIHSAIIQDVQWHPVEEQVLHIDFLNIKKGTVIKTKIPIKTEGTAKGVLEGGKLYVNLRKLKVKALPKNLPDNITVDVSELGVGDNIQVRDVEIEDVEILNVKTNVIVAVTVPRIAKADAETEETEGEDIEGTEGETTEGETTTETPAEA